MQVVNETDILLSNQGFLVSLLHVPQAVSPEFSLRLKTPRHSAPICLSGWWLSLYVCWFHLKRQTRLIVIRSLWVWPWSTLCGSAGSPWRCGWGWWCCLWHWHWCDAGTGLRRWQTQHTPVKTARWSATATMKALSRDLTKGDVSDVVTDSGVCVLQLQRGFPVAEQHLWGGVAGSSTLFELLQTEWV